MLRGLEDAWFLFDLIGDAENASVALKAAKRCRSGLSSMYRVSSGCYAMYERVFPKWRKWYPDVTSQAFPLLYQLIPSDDSTAQV
ncbi:hypothetical protein MXD63_44965, partial [Frankia sp. Cpl3]|nr:hypothetical protein [Frankia sp. Cpl3]